LVYEEKWDLKENKRTLLVYEEKWDLKEKYFQVRPPRLWLLPKNGSNHLILHPTIEETPYKNNFKEMAHRQAPLYLSSSNTLQ
jgi:hypothetical protein